MVGAVWDFKKSIASTFMSRCRHGEAIARLAGTEVEGQSAFLPVYMPQFFFELTDCTARGHGGRGRADTPDRSDSASGLFRATALGATLAESSGLRSNRVKILKSMEPFASVRVKRWS